MVAKPETIRLGYSAVFAVGFSLFPPAVYGLFLYNILQIGIQQAYLPFLVVTAVFGLMFLLAVGKLLIPFLRKQPALELTPEGLFDRFNGLSTPWSNIKGFHMSFGAKGSGFIRVLLVDDRALEGAYDNAFKALRARMRKSASGSAFTINPGVIAGSRQTILETLQTYLDTVGSGKGTKPFI
jgi:hypothetical protein